MVLSLPFFALDARGVRGFGFVMCGETGTPDSVNALKRPHAAGLTSWKRFHMIGETRKGGWSNIASHERLGMLVDPHINLTVWVQASETSHGVNVIAVRPLGKSNHEGAHL
jgi:hypothetical protein